MKRIYLTCIKCCACMLLAQLFSCSEQDTGAPANDKTVPLQVTDVKVTPIAGGGILTYQIPPNSNILYVMAEYELDDGLHDQKTSYFGNSVTLEGFPDTKPYNVKLYSVSRSGVKSEPVPETVVPLEPPFLEAYKSLQTEPTFGGMKVSFENKDRANLKFVITTVNDEGKYYQAYTHYTKIETGVFAIRGFDTTPRVFGIYTLDRWNHQSDTLFVTVTPWYEEQLDKKRFVNAKLPSDVWDWHMSASYALESAWDNVWGTGVSFHSKPNTGIPQWFTIDLRVRARLSRMKFYHRTSTGTDGQYNAGDPQIFEIWGSNTLVDEYDSHWELLGHFESKKPSGSAGGTYTDEDKQYACIDGEDFDFTNNSPFRYLRFKTVKTWGNLSYVYVGELTFFGEVTEKF